MCHHADDICRSVAAIPPQKSDHVYARHRRRDRGRKYQSDRCEDDQTKRRDFPRTERRTATISAKGMMQVRLSTQGKSSHGSRPWDGQNAIEHLAFCLTQFRLHHPTPTRETRETTYKRTISHRSVVDMPLTKSPRRPNYGVMSDSTHSIPLRMSSPRYAPNSMAVNYSSRKMNHPSTAQKHRISSRVSPTLSKQIP